MNDRKSTSPEDSGQPPVAGAPVSLSRRRFAKAAAPVLLGTLASKPVLGAEYICTVSGHASGNASAHLTEGVDCSPAGAMNVDNWRTADWTGTGIVKGGLRLNDGDKCKWQDSKGTAFNNFTAGAFKLIATFYHSQTPGPTCGMVGIVKGDGFGSASMYQVLMTDIGDELFELARVTVASLLNAGKFGSAYPVSQERIIEMFNKVRNGGNYDVPGANLPLTRSEVIAYLEKLFT